jgi:hypothetical protein
MGRLDGAKFKLARASKHIEELDAAARAYLASAPFVVERTELPNGDLACRVRIRHHVPPEWSTVIGDAVHNLRSALDLLAWQLVEVGGATASQDTCFPVTRSGAQQFRQLLRRALRGAGPRVIRFVSRLKPFDGGNQALVRLHALDISDKHRLTLVVGAAHKHIVMNVKMAVPWQDVPVEFPPIALNPNNRQFPMQDGAEVFRICAAARKSDDLTQFNLVFELAFGSVDEVKGLPLVETLQSMHKHVSRIVRIAENRFFR